jgi:Tfp pilus assembly protein PilN
MIQINLLPGHEGGAAAARGVGAALAAARQRVLAVAADKYLWGGLGAAAAAAAAVALLHTAQAARAAEAEAREGAAVADSTRYAAMLAARRSAVAERDSVRRQLAVIAEIDSTRYAWAHVMDEVSRALPPYTWLTAVQQTSAPPTPDGLADSAAVGAATRGAAGAAAKLAADSAARAAEDEAPAERPLLTFRVVGQTVDIQALTAFMRELEASPFVQRVQLARSDAVQADGKEVTEFTLDAQFERPARSLVRTERLTVAVAPPR